MQENADILKVLADGDQDERAATRHEITKALHQADAYLSLMHRYRDAVPHDVYQEMIAASSECRSLVQRIERHGIKHGKTLTQDDWDA